MERTRTSKAALLALACLLLGPGIVLAAEPVPARALSRSEVPSLIAAAVTDWAKGLDEVKALELYIRDKGNWSPRFMAGAGAAGAAFGYFEGGKGSARLGVWDVSFDTSGKTLHQAIARGNGRLLGIGLGRPDQGWSAEAVLGLRDGRFLGETVTLAYKVRY